MLADNLQMLIKITEINNPAAIMIWVTSITVLHVFRYLLLGILSPTSMGASKVLTVSHAKFDINVYYCSNNTFSHLPGFQTS